MILGPALREGERVLAVLPNWVGDAVQCEPALRALAARVGAASLTLAADPHLLELLEGAFSGARRLPHVPETAERARRWRGHDVAVLFVGSFRSAFTAWRARIPRRAGWWRDGRAWLLTDGATPARERGGVPLGLGTVGGSRRYLPRPFGATCQELVGWLGVPVADTRPRLRSTPEARGRAEALSEGLGEGFVLAAVGARPGSAKAWPAAHWGRALAEIGRASGRALLLVGGPGEEEVVEGVARAVEAAGHAAPRVAIPDLQELLALARRAALVLAADGGARHVAAAAGARVLWLAGPTDPRHSADHVLPGTPLREPVRCGPCHLERCPRTGAEHHRCMEGLDPDRVRIQALALLR